MWSSYAWHVKTWKLFHLGQEADDRVGIFCDEVLPIWKECTKFYFPEHSTHETTEKVTLPMVQIFSLSLLCLKVSVTLRFIFFFLFSSLYSSSFSPERHLAVANCWSTKSYKISLMFFFFFLLHFWLRASTTISTLYSDLQYNLRF